MMRDNFSHISDGHGCPADTYTHGHHESVLRSHRWRTAENSAGYLLAYLRPGQKLLDVGCGPGTITADLAGWVAPGTVVGLDSASDVLESAQASAAAAGRSNVDFAVGDAYELGYADASFDVVHAHQVLQHLSQPVTALQEMRRVCRPDGVVAVRDSDYAAMTWYPETPGLGDWLDLYRQVARGNHAEPDAGRRIHAWARAAGFGTITASTSTWCFATHAERTWWAGLWADRLTESALGEQAIERGLATRTDLARLANAWRSWAEEPDGWFCILHGEVRASP